MLSARELDGDFEKQLAQKSREIRRLYEEAILTDPDIRAYAEKAAGRGSAGVQASRLFSTLKPVVNYVADPVGFEMFKSPRVMIREIRERGSTAGDCDDQALLAYTMLQAIGIPSKFRVVRVPDGRLHIYPLAKVYGGWFAFDLTRGAFGDEAPRSAILREFSA